jgi:hypothetical protein
MYNYYLLVCFYFNYTVHLATRIFCPFSQLVFFFSFSLLFISCHSLSHQNHLGDDYYKCMISISYSCFEPFFLFYVKYVLFKSVLLYVHSECCRFAFTVLRLSIL